MAPMTNEVRLLKALRAIEEALRASREMRGYQTVSADFLQRVKRAIDELEADSQDTPSRVRG